MTVASTQNCTALAEQCKAMHNEGHHGSREFRLAGKIPEIFVTKYINENNITLGEFCGNREHVRRVLSDPALSYFRVWKGAI